MLRTLISFVLVIGFFWFFPDIYLWTRGVSNALFQEAANQTSLRVEVKVTKPMFFLPLKFGVLGRGEKGYYVEFYDEVSRSAKGAATSEGTALLPGVLPGTYAVRVAALREFSEIEMKRSVEYGESLLDDAELLPTTLSSLTVTRDVFTVAVLKNE